MRSRFIAQRNEIKPFATITIASSRSRNRSEISGEKTSNAPMNILYTPDYFYVCKSIFSGEFLSIMQKIWLFILNYSSVEKKMQFSTVNQTYI